MGRLCAPREMVSPPLVPHTSPPPHTPFSASAWPCPLSKLLLTAWRLHCLPVDKVLHDVCWLPAGFRYSFRRKRLRPPAFALPASRPPPACCLGFCCRCCCARGGRMRMAHTLCCTSQPSITRRGRPARAACSSESQSCSGSPGAGWERRASGVEGGRVGRAGVRCVPQGMLEGIVWQHAHQHLG